MRDLSALLYLLIPIYILIGGLQCFFGYRFFRMMLKLTGFIIGATLFGLLVYDYNDGKLISGIAGGFFGGLILATIFSLVYDIGIILIGALCGAIIGIALFDNTNMFVALIILGGALAHFAQKFIIITSTAIIGAWTIVYSINYLFHVDLPVLYYLNGYLPKSEEYLFLIIAWLILSTFGIYTQYKTAKPNLETQTDKASVESENINIKKKKSIENNKKKTNSSKFLNKTIPIKQIQIGENSKKYDELYLSTKEKWVGIFSVIFIFIFVLFLLVLMSYK